MSHLTITRVYREAEGTTLGEALTTSFNDGSDILVRNVNAGFDEDGGYFTLRNGSVSEVCTYDGYDESTSKLLRCTRPNTMLNWAIDTMVEAGDDGEAESPLLCDGYLDGDLETLAVEIPIEPQVERHYLIGPRERDQYETAEVSIDEDGSVKAVIGAPISLVGREPAIVGGTLPGQLGGRYAADSAGFRLYNEDEELTFNAESATGDLSISGALVTGGTIQTAAPVEGETRVVISDTVSLDAITWYEHTGGVDVQIAALNRNAGELLLTSSENLEITAGEDILMSAEGVSITTDVDNINFIPGTGFGVKVLGTGQLSLGDGTTTDGRLRIYDDVLDSEPALPSDATYCTQYYHRRTGLSNQLKVAFSTGRIVLATAP